MKKLLTGIVLVAIAASLAACTYEEENIMYEGKVRPVSEVEELISDQLEIENPNIDDIEVDIWEVEE